MIDLDRVGSDGLRGTEGYRGFCIGKGRVRHFYLGAIFKGRALEVVGPAHNAETALRLARRWVDTLLDGDNQARQEPAQQVTLRALQKLEAVSRGPAAAVQCAKAEDRQEICRSVQALCDAIENDIRWLGARRN